MNKRRLLSAHVRSGHARYSKTSFDEWCQQQEDRLFTSLFVTLPYGASCETAQQRELRQSKEEAKATLLTTEVEATNFEYRR